jgi:hypothetical protein
MAAELRSLAGGAKRIDLVARYGASAVWLARLLNPQAADRQSLPHCKAGGETLSHLLLNRYTTTAEEFHRLQSGSAKGVKLIEASIINLFLKNLVEALPDGSVWLGISRLQASDAWGEGKAEPSYYDSENAVERCIRAKNLKYLRLLCFETQDRYAEMRHIISQQLRKGIHLQLLIKKDLPADMSLIWGPPTMQGGTFNVQDPIRSLENQGHVPLCGLAFGIRADREVYTMDLFVPSAPEFLEFNYAFGRAWADTGSPPAA